MSKYQKAVGLAAGTLLLSLATGVFNINNTVAEEVESNVTIEEISEGEDVTVGEAVTVRGEVEDLESGVSFFLENDQLFDEERVLVINVSGELLPISPDDETRLQVTGEVAALTIAEVERDYDITLNPEIYVEYQTQRVILAQSIVLAPEIEEVAENPDLYYGQEIAVEGEIEAENDYTFVLEEDKLIADDNILIINATGQPLPTEEEKVVLTGTVRPYIEAEFDRDYDLTWDLELKEQIEAEYTEKPVMVVDGIYPSAEETGFLEGL